MIPSAQRGPGCRADGAPAAWTCTCAPTAALPRARPCRCADPGRRRLAGGDTVPVGVVCGETATRRARRLACPAAPGDCGGWWCLSLHVEMRADR